MRITIVPVDGVVGINGEFRKIANLAQNFPTVHAVQWDGVMGHIEHNDGTPNESVTDIAQFQSAVDAWNALTPPPKTAAELLQDAKDGQTAIIEATYQSANSAPISFLGRTFQADASSVALMAQVATALPSGATVTWYDANNVDCTMTDAQFVELRGAILMRGQPLFAKKQALKAAIRAATTVAEVEAVVW